ncbi:MAG: lytic murein transglycosylase [Pseudomonadota bacterium]
MSKVSFATHGALALSLAGVICLSGSAVTAQVGPSDEGGFSAYTVTLAQDAAQQGVSQRTLSAVIPTLAFDPRVVALDRRQPGADPNAPIPKFAPYYARHVDSVRIAAGRIKYQELRPLLGRVERETGVPESIMISIYGNETAYGKVTGNFDLANALATLAFEGRRRALFSSEFIATLKMMDRGVPREQLKGSWAGATGYPQFLPSMYIRLGRDGDGDGRADIWSNEADALASIANYFVNAGWRAGVPWGTRANVPVSLDRSAIKSRTVAPRCPRVHERHSQWKTIAEWRALGVTPFENKRFRDSELASLIEPDGPDAPAYLLTGNYRVILEYNCSNFYGLSVGLLADAVEK